jgi:hypothetical protein
VWYTHVAVTTPAVQPVVAPIFSNVSPAKKIVDALARVILPLMVVEPLLFGPTPRDVVALIPPISQELAGNAVVASV